MPSQEEIAEQQELLVSYRRTLAHYLRQKADLGDTQIPPGIANGIADARENIRQIKGVLQSWNINVEDHPNDERRSFSVGSENEAAGLKKIYSSRVSSWLLIFMLVLFCGTMLWSLYDRTRILAVIDKSSAQLSDMRIIQSTQQSELLKKSTEISSANIIQATQFAEISRLQSTTTPGTTIIINRDIIDRSHLYSTINPNPNYSFDDNSKQIRLWGPWDQRLWITDEMPRNFRATIVLKTQDAMTVTLGLGNGSDLFPGLILWLDTAKSVFVDNPDQQHWNVQSQSDKPEDLTRQNSRYIIIFERNNGVIQAYLNGYPILDPITNKQMANQHNHLFISTNYQKSQSGILIEDITIDRVN